MEIYTSSGDAARIGDPCLADPELASLRFLAMAQPQQTQTKRFFLITYDHGRHVLQFVGCPRQRASACLSGISYIVNRATLDST